MLLNSRKAMLRGEMWIPASKSHTIRAIAIATMARGRSVLRRPLISEDALSCVEAARKFGASVDTSDDYIVEGIGGFPRKIAMIDVGNSGTTLRIFTALAALSNQPFTFDGDASIRQRPMEPLFTALQQLKVRVDTPNGRCPFTIQGPLHGGKTSVRAVSSQFLTALLLASPLAPQDIEINVELLNEQPYIDITLDWLKKQYIQYEQSGYEWFRIKGNQHYKPFDMHIPADFSTATFALVAAVVSGGEVLLRGLDFNDSQGDKVIFSHLEKMGAVIRHGADYVVVKSNPLQGMDIDMNATPDALPAMAVAGCYAQGTTRLLNVPQARLKECDRIKACFSELTKMGAQIEELSDGLVIRNSKLHGAEVNGYNDHRMVMSLAIAGMMAEGTTTITTAEAAGVTYPGFVSDFTSLGADFVIQ